MAKSTSVNSEVSAALVTLRDRSRNMVRNNGWARRAVEAITKHTIGDGIQPAPDADLATCQLVKRLWSKWANSTACDWYGKTTFYGLQELAMRSIAESGEVLILRRWVMPDDNNPLPLQLQVLEGDQLDHTRNGSNDMGYCRLGVQFSKEGRLLGYWLLITTPATALSLHRRLPASFTPRRMCYMLSRCCGLDRSEACRSECRRL